MTNAIKEEYRILASLAVFRGLYDSKKDVYGIISEFVVALIESKRLIKFSSTEITRLLNDEFDFSLPEAVVKTALGRLKFLRRRDGYYFVKSITLINRNIVEAIQEETLSINDIIEKNLYDYIFKHKNCELDGNEKSKIIRAFCAFLLDKSNVEERDEYSKYISSFIVDNGGNNDFRNKLNQIREGLLLYSGLKYNNDGVFTWLSELTIYLDTEILFHLAGYNGRVYEFLFRDFYNLVQEINTNAKKRMIRLAYFREVKDEINNFFASAERIVEGNSIPDPNKTAMISIVEGCRSPSDVAIKKASFFRLLEQYGIKEIEESEFYTQENFRFNIEDRDTIKKLSDELGFDVSEHLKFLNYINILRGTNNKKGFFEVRHLLLTGNSNTLKVAFHPLIRVEREVPLASSLYRLTNEFWFKLNKGFGDGELPKSVDVLIKAQVVLSSILKESIAQKYEVLIEKFRNGEITKEDAVVAISELRSRVRTPEEIEENETNYILEFLNQDAIEDIVMEHEMIKIENNELHKVNNELNRENDQLHKKNSELHKENSELHKENSELNKKNTELLSITTELYRELLLSKQMRLDEVNKRINEIDEVIDKFKKKSKNYTRIIGVALGLVIIFYWFIIAYVNFLNVQTFWTHVIDTILYTLPIFIVFVTGRSINPLSVLNKIESCVNAKMLKKVGNEIDELEALWKQKETLELEINNIIETLHKDESSFDISFGVVQ